MTYFEVDILNMALSLPLLSVDRIELLALVSFDASDPQEQL